MYSSQRPPSEHGQQEYAIQGNTSPAQTPSQGYSPSMRANRPRMSSASGPPQSPQYNRSHPTSPAIARMPIGGPPVHPQERPSVGYYDPTSDSRDYNPSKYQPRSPVGVRILCITRNVDSNTTDPTQPRAYPQPLDRYPEPNGYHQEHQPSRSRQASQSSPRQPLLHTPQPIVMNGREIGAPHVPQSAPSSNVSTSSANVAVLG